MISAYAALCSPKRYACIQSSNLGTQAWCCFPFLTRLLISHSQEAEQKEGKGPNVDREGHCEIPTAAFMRCGMVSERKPWSLLFKILQCTTHTLNTHIHALTMHNAQCTMHTFTHNCRPDRQFELMLHNSMSKA
jgi:hypothetical protein